MRHLNAMKLPMILTGALAVSALGGCSQESSSQDPEPDATAVDSGVSPDAAPTPDAEPVPDAAIPDMALPDMDLTDAAPPRRTLVDHNPFGDDPPGNLVMNPSLDLFSSVAAIALPTGEGAERLNLPASPTGQPAVRLRNTEGMIVPFQSRPGPLSASIWLGTADGVERDLSVTLLALPRGEGTIEGVALEATDETQTLEGMRQADLVWRKYAGEVDVELLGHSYLLVDNPTGNELWLTGPRVAVAASAKGANGAARARLKASPLSTRLQSQARLASKRVAERRKTLWEAPKRPWTATPAEKPTLKLLK